MFAVTRVIFIPQGEFVAYGALTLALLQLGKVPGTVWLLLALALLAALLDAGRGAAARRAGGAACRAALRTLARAPVAGRRRSTLWAAPRKLPLLVQSLLTLAIVTPLGPLVYRLAYEKLADATVLVLLIVSVGVHFALTGLGLVFFGAEGFRNPSFWDARFSAGALTLSGQTIIIFLVSIALIVALWLFFERTLRGKALRATAVNRLGARLMGISTSGAGRLSFGLAAFIGALSGLLIGPATTMFYDSGFLIGLKGFVAAIFGGLASYPAAALGALIRRPARELRLVLGQRVQGGDRLHADHPGAAVALVPARPRRRGRVTIRRSSLPTPARCATVLIALASPCSLARAAAALPVPEFWITQANYIGLYTLVVLGLVLLTGIAGLTSFGQAAFVGLGAYTAAYLTVTHGVSPWLTVLDRPRRDRARGARARPGSRCACRATTCRSRRSPGGCRCTTCSATSSALGKYDGLLGIPALKFFGIELNTGRSFFYLLWALVAAGGDRGDPPARFARRPRAARGEGRHRRWPRRWASTPSAPRSPRSCSPRCSRASRAGCSRTSSAP